MKHYFLNKGVEEEVFQSELLFVAWFSRYGLYDDEIDPLHQEGWVRQAKQKEVEKLEQLKKDLKVIIDWYVKELDSRPMLPRQSGQEEVKT